jgi:hypothetical protein
MTYNKVKLFIFKINKGILENCHFLSALSAVALYPKYIKRLISNFSNEQKGYFSVWLFIDGYWQYFIIDLFIPLDNNN